jgi:hypothetical protein
MLYDQLGCGGTGCSQQKAVDAKLQSFRCYGKAMPTTPTPSLAMVQLNSNLHVSMHSALRQDVLVGEVGSQQRDTTPDSSR